MLPQSGDGGLYMYAVSVCLCVFINIFTSTLESNIVKLAVGFIFHSSQMSTSVVIYTKTGLPVLAFKGLIHSMSSICRSYFHPYLQILKAENQISCSDPCTSQDFVVFMFLDFQFLQVISYWHKNECLKSCRSFQLI